MNVAYRDCRTSRFSRSSDFVEALEELLTAPEDDRRVMASSSMMGAIIEEGAVFMGCAHEGCSCRVDQSDGVCSEYCRQQGAEPSQASHACGCGHPECTGSSSEADDRTGQDIQAAFE